MARLMSGMRLALREIWQSSPMYDWLHPVDATGCPGGENCNCDRKEL